MPKKTLVIFAVLVLALLASGCGRSGTYLPVGRTQFRNIVIESSRSGYLITNQGRVNFDPVFTDVVCDPDIDDVSEFLRIENELAWLHVATGERCEQVMQVFGR